ncbi:hypothetical protein MOQ27_20745 [Escherichia coli]|uniref:hypothetical protein n=1 Tax=Escherichia coli TaxID=562 RepID=UPI002147D607|nr:hypothetical protein [Escherichia coli]MCR1124461.1 hypothetical protein [Escherichia coli]
MSDISLREMDYNASIGVNVPLERFFHHSTLKTNAINSMKNNIDSMAILRELELLRLISITNFIS